MARTKVSMLREIEELKKELQAVKDDRAKFRVFIARELRSNIQLVRENKYFEPKVLLERHIDFIKTVESFYLWG